MNKLLYILICLGIAGNVFAQSIVGKTDKKEYMIGDPIEYSFSIPLTNKNLNFTSDFQFSETIQMLQTSIDTSKDKINYKYVFASFIEGVHKLPEFQFYLANQTSPAYVVQSPNVEILSPVIDTTKIEVKPIKGVMKIPFTFKEILPFAIGGIVLTGIIIAIIYFVRRTKNKTKSPQTIKEAAIPEDEEALNNLKRLKQARLLETGQEKQHYIALSEILWQYIYRRFNVNAFEKTTNQIMEEMLSKDVSQEDNKRLENIFTTSDLVKFAKYIPDTRTNLNLLQDSEDFINNNKRLEPIKDDTGTKEEKEVINE